MNITHAFIQRLAAMDPYSLGIFLQQNKSQIDFNGLIAKAKEQIKMNGAILLNENIDSNERIVLENQTDKISALIEDSVIYAAAQSHPNAVEGPFLENNHIAAVGEVQMKTFT